MENKVKEGPLKGLMVADFTQLAQGPWATQMLGDMGADIIKIEPVSGDWMRHYSYDNLYPKGESISFVCFNRNKRSIALNLKAPQGNQIAKDIIAKADILVENFRPGVMERLGLGYDDMKVLNPGLVYCSSSGYGSSGPYLRRPGQDLLAQSIGGGAARTLVFSIIDHVDRKVGQPSDRCLVQRYRRAEFVRHQKLADTQVCYDR